MAEFSVQEQVNEYQASYNIIDYWPFPGGINTFRPSGVQLSMHALTTVYYMCALIV
jgi:hypothetical protein